MPTIFLDKAKAGMVLSKPVLSEQGEVLFNEGTVLLEKVLTDLSGLNVKYIFVQDNPALAARKPKGGEARAEQELEERFSRAGATPALLKIKEAIRAQLKGSAKKNASLP